MYNIYKIFFTLLQYVNQRLQIQLELLMMSDMPLETCWAFNERWINKFYYKVASCWLYLLSYAISFIQKLTFIFLPPTNIALLSQLLNIAVPTVDYTGKINAATCLPVYKAIANRGSPFIYTGCPTRYRTRHFFNNFTTNEDTATKFEADLPHCVRNVKEKNVLLFKFCRNIFIDLEIC